MDDGCCGESALGKHHDIHTAFIKCYAINKNKLEPSILCVKTQSAFRDSLNSLFPCCDQHKNMGRTQTNFFLLTNTKFIVFYKNAINPVMDNAVIRRLCNLFLHFSYSPWTCAPSSVELRRKKARSQGLRWDSRLSRNLSQPFSVCPVLPPPPHDPTSNQSSSSLGLGKAFPSLTETTKETIIKFDWLHQKAPWTKLQGKWQTEKKNLHYTMQKNSNMSRKIWAMDIVGNYTMCIMA